MKENPFLCAAFRTHTHTPGPTIWRVRLSVDQFRLRKCGSHLRPAGLFGPLACCCLLNDANLMFQLSAALPRSFSPGYMISEFVKRKEGTKHNHQNRWIIINSEGRPHVSLIMLVRHLGDPHFVCVSACFLRVLVSTPTNRALSRRHTSRRPSCAVRACKKRNA